MLWGWALGTQQTERRTAGVFSTCELCRKLEGSHGFPDEQLHVWKRQGEDQHFEGTQKSEVSGPHARGAECVSVEGGAWRSGVDSNTLMTPRLVIRTIFGDNLLKDEMCPRTVSAVFA